MLTSQAKQREGNGEGQAHAQAVEDAGHDTVLGCKGLSTTQNDAVHHDERDEKPQTGIHIGRIRLDEHL